MSKTDERPRLDFRKLRIDELRRKCDVVARSTEVAEKIWNLVLKDAHRKAAGGTFAKAVRKHDGVDLWMQVYRVSRLRAGFDIAKRFNFISETDHQELLEDAGEPFVVEERDADYEQIVESIVPKSRLVVIDEPPEVFFEGKPIAIGNWTSQRALWAYWWQLCRACRLGDSLDASSFGAAGKGYLAGKKYRLKSLPEFPAELGRLIRSTGLRTQTLGFKPDEVRVFEAVAGRYREVLARSVMQ